MPYIVGGVFGVAITVAVPILGVGKALAGVGFTAGAF